MNLKMRWFKNKLLEKGFPVPIEYKTKNSGFCLIKCPYNQVEKVSSWGCQLCKYYVKKRKINLNKGVIFCKFNKKE